MRGKGCFKKREILSGDSTIRGSFQNVRGGISESKDGSRPKLDELRARMHRNQVNFAMLAETWEEGDWDYLVGEESDYLFLHHGEKSRSCHRGRLGVGIMLSPDARAAHQRAGGEKTIFGDRIVAVRLHLLDPAGGTVSLCLRAHIPTLCRGQGRI